ncbi:MarR family winged helix-turn-helix transcriptional regulator [Streptomyces sp. NPDC016675]|uniref:MarR family winged helix-turn-helix transcriptional regulator n=1 Tax=Streptomyces sp. NPDC016675 TaxID=3364970 RepID=UPI0037008F93
MSSPTSERLEQVWRDILTLHAHTVSAIDRELDAHGLGASDFEVLNILAALLPEESDRCRVQDLAGRVHLSQSGLSRLIGRLSETGLVERASHQQDRRGVWISLTRKGRELRNELLPVHRAVLARMLAGCGETC